MDWLVFFTFFISVAAIFVAAVVALMLVLWIDRRLGEPWGLVITMMLIVIGFSAMAGMTA